jgi:xanthine dehydrogenase accessory factor
MEPPRATVLVKGAGEQASATAHRLFKCGYRVVMTEVARPTAVRRTVSFCTAVYEGSVEVEGVRAEVRALEGAGGLATFDWSHIPVFVDPDCRLLALWRPGVLVDARILKTNLDNRISDAPLVIGLGPGIEAGRDVHFVVETNRGHNLGRIIGRGQAARDTGRPGEIAGYTHERVLLSPVAGVFESDLEIGAVVSAGQPIGSVDSREVRAGVSGVLRGPARPGIAVAVRQKLGDVDPRGEPDYCHTFSDKARTISGSVLEIVIGHAASKRDPAR